MKTFYKSKMYKLIILQLLIFFLFFVNTKMSYSDQDTKWEKTVKTNTLEAYIDYHELYPKFHVQDVKNKILSIISQTDNASSKIHNPAILDAHSTVVQKNNRISAHNVKITYPNLSSMTMLGGSTYGYFGEDETYTMSGPIAHISFDSQVSYTFIIDDGTMIFKGDKKGLHYISGKGIGLVSDKEKRKVYTFGPEERITTQDGDKTKVGQ